jgi:hypothetical protein
MSETEKLICGDCKRISEIKTGKRGSNLVSIILWTTLFFPGIFYSMWRRGKPKKICEYCGSDFLLPADSIHTHELLKPITKNN